MRAMLIAALVAVTGCAGVGEVVTGFGAPQPGLRTMSMFDGAVRVRGPEGYCIDRQASRTGTGFVVMAACARVSGAATLPAQDGLLTVQIGEEGSALVAGNEEALMRMLAEGAGRGLLSDGGGPVTVHRAVGRPGLVLVRYTDPAAQAMAGTEAPGWRAFLDLRGRSAVISLRAFESAPLDAAGAESLIRAAAAELVAVNG